MNERLLSDAIDYTKSWLEFNRKRSDIPGLVVAILYRGELILNQAFGYADIKSRTKLTPEHLFRIASHSKTFTATALMQLQEAGKLSIDDRLAKYLPQLQSHRDKRWRQITLRQVMSHGAGIVREGTNGDYWNLIGRFLDESELERQLLEADLAIEPNTKLKYSNFGYALLGLVVAKVSGQPYNEYVRQHIIEVLQLSNIGPEYETGRAADYVTGYTRDDYEHRRLPIDTIDTHAMSPAAGFYANAEAICRYMAAQFVGSGKLLSDESKKEMQKVHWHADTPFQSSAEDYGLGFELEYPGGRKLFGHGGGFPGQITETLADPDNQMVISVLTNSIDGPANVAVKSIYHIIDFFQELKLAKKPKIDLSRFSGRYFSLFSEMDFVVAGDHIAVSYPGSWQPLSSGIDELEYVDETTLRVKETDSFGSEGELVKFTFNNGNVESVNFGSFTIWPESRWRELQTSSDAVHLIN